MREILVPWDSQPQEAAELAQGTSLSQSLAFFSHAGQAQELTSGRLPTTRNAPPIPTEYGLAAQCATGRTNVEWDSTYIRTSNGVGSGDFTIAVLANPGATGDGQIEHMFAQKNDAGGSPFAQAFLGAHAQSAGAYLSGSVAFFTFAGSNSGVSSAGATDGAFHVWVGRRRGTTHEIIKDGVVIGTSVSTVRTITQASTRFVAIGSRGNGTSQGYRNEAVWAAGWDRAVDDAELQDMLGSRIWQLFAPRTQYIPTASGVLVPTLGAPTFVPGSLTASGFRVRVPSTWA